MTVLRLAVGCLLLVGCSSVPVTPTPSAIPTLPPTVTPTASQTQPPTLAPPTLAPPTQRASSRVAFGDGTHLVPGDIAPGTYRTIAYTTNCYWTRLSGFANGLADWIASDIGSGYRVVTIGESDAGFDSQNCGGWTDDLSAVLESVTPIREGTYIVGTDISPGTYVASDGSNCYWARLSGFGGLDPERLDEALVTTGTSPSVTIEPTDAGFTSNGCGLWRVAE